MKKLIFTIMSIVALSFGAYASSTSEYYINDQEVESVINSATDVTADLMNASLPSLTNPLINLTGEMKTGDNDAIIFLALDFFLGGVAAHRYYMGVDGAWYMFLGYACVPIAGSIAACGDFIWVLIDQNNLSEYEDNKRYFVFA